ncbi:MAG: helix-turn-helix domain-containing protein [archaeon]|jgi:sugar-specific transcriptional regulator TrmB
MDFAFLDEVGLTKNEKKIYSALLNLGSVTAGRITYETSLHRSRVYEGLNRLVGKGLVAFVKKGVVTYFQTTSPEKLLDYLEEEKLKLDEKKKKISEVLPQLKEFNQSKPTAQAYILEGLEGFKAMRRDVLKYAQKEHLIIGAIAKEDKAMPLFFKKWNQERIRKKIKLRILHKESARGEKMTKLKLMETRFLPSHIDNPAVINIYGDRVVNVLWKNNSPICFVMTNKDIADAYQKYFELLWEISKK